MASNKTDAKVTKVELGKGWKKAIKNFEKETEGEESKNEVAIIGHSAHQQWWNIKTAQTGLARHTDVYKMLARYCQKELGLYKESGYDIKFAKVETLSSKKEEYSKHIEERRKNLTETEEWIKTLYSNYIQNGGRGQRFSQPLFYTVVFVRDGKFAGIKGGPSTW